MVSDGRPELLHVFCKRTVSLLLPDRALCLPQRRKPFTGAATQTPDCFGKTHSRNRTRAIAFGDHQDEVRTSDDHALRWMGTERPWQWLSATSVRARALGSSTLTVRDWTR